MEQKKKCNEIKMLNLSANSYKRQAIIIIITTGCTTQSGSTTTITRRKKQQPRVSKYYTCRALTTTDGETPVIIIKFIAFFNALF